MEEQLVETWNIHARINLYLLDAIPLDAMVRLPESQEQNGLSTLRAHPQRQADVAEVSCAGIA